MENLDELSLLMDFNQFVIEISDLTWLEPHESLSVEQLSLSMPIELEIVADENESVNLKGGAPTQIIETSYMPVFHSMKLKVISRYGEKRKWQLEP